MGTATHSAPEEEAQPSRASPPPIQEGESLAGHEIIGVDGQPNVVIVDRNTGIRKAHDKDTGQDYCRFILWPPDVFPAVHGVSVVRTEGARQVYYDLSIAGDRATISQTDIHTGDWMTPFPRISGTFHRQSESQYKAIIQQLARLAPLATIYDSPGLHLLPGEDKRNHYVFILPDGRVIAPESADVPRQVTLALGMNYSEQELEKWQRLTIPAADALPDRTKQQATYQWVRSVAPRGQMLLALSHSFLALLTGLVSDDLTLGHGLVLLAEHASGKTSLAGASRMIVSPLRYKYEPDASFVDTVTSVEGQLARRRHLPCFIDDLPKARTEGEHREQAKTLDRIFRAVFNRTPVRRRMTHRMQRQRENRIDTAPMATVEELPRDLPASFYRRVLVATIGQDEIRKKGAGSLEDTNLHADMLRAWGYGFIRYFLEAIELQGYETITARLAQERRNYERRLDALLRDLWRKREPRNTLPGFYDSIIENAAAEWLAFSYWQRLADASIDEHDFLPHLLEIIYNNILRIEGRNPDDPEGGLFERALYALFDEIALEKTVDGKRARVDTYCTDVRETSAHPMIYTAQGRGLDKGQWGWKEETDAQDCNHENGHRSPLTIAYTAIDRPGEPSTGVFYLTMYALEEMVDHLRRSKAEGAPQTVRELVKLAERENWIKRHEDKDHLMVRIGPHAKRIRCLAVDLARLVALIAGDEESETTPRPPVPPQDEQEVSAILARLDTPEEIQQRSSALWPVASQGEAQAPQPLAPCTFFDDCGQAGVGYSPSGIWLCKRCASICEVRITA